MAGSAREQLPGATVPAWPGGVAHFAGLAVGSQFLSQPITHNLLPEGTCTVDTDCAHGGQCSGTAPNRACSCLPGWSGIDCNVKEGVCTVSADCTHGGQCVGTAPSRTCQCVPGWSGPLCGTLGLRACVAWSIPHSGLFQRVIALRAVIAITTGLAKARPQRSRVNARPGGPARCAPNRVC